MFLPPPTSLLNVGLEDVARADVLDRPGDRRLVAGRPRGEPERLERVAAAQDRPRGRPGRRSGVRARPRGRQFTAPRRTTPPSPGRAPARCRTSRTTTRAGADPGGPGRAPRRPRCSPGTRSSRRRTRTLGDGRERLVEDVLERAGVAAHAGRIGGNHVGAASPGAEERGPGGRRRAPAGALARARGPTAAADAPPRTPFGRTYQQANRDPGATALARPTNHSRPDGVYP